MPTKLERKSALLFFSLAIILIIIYRATLHGGYYHDDRPNLVFNSKVQISTLDIESLSIAATSSGSGTLKRPVSMTSFALNYYFFGNDPLSFRITNLIIHFLNSFLVFFIALRLRTLTIPSDSKNKIFLFAAATTMIWAIHPLHVSTVAYIVQRMTLLSTFFSLSAIIFYLNARKNNITYNKLSFKSYTICGLCLILGVFSKENAALTPIIIVLIELIIIGKLRNSTNKNFDKAIIASASLLIIASILFSENIFNYFNNWYESVRDFSLRERILTQLRIIMLYVKWLFYPNIQEMGLYHDDIELSKSLFQPISTFICGAAIVIIASTGLLIKNKFPLSSLGIAWFFTGHLLESTIIPLEMLYEHRNYFPFLGLILVTLDLLFKLFDRHRGIKSYKFLFVVSAIAVFSLATYTRGQQWSSPIDFAYFEALHHPKSPRANHQLGMEYLDLVEQGQHQYKEDAYKYLNIASQLNSRYLQSETALIKLASLLDEPADPIWIDRITEKLENNIFRGDALRLLEHLLMCEKSQCWLPIEASDLLINAIERNKRLKLNSKLHSSVKRLKAKHLITRKNDMVLAEETYLIAIDIDQTVIQNYIDYAHLLSLLNRTNEAFLIIDQALTIANSSHDKDVLNQLKTMLSKRENPQNV